MAHLGSKAIDTKISADVQAALVSRCGSPISGKRATIARRQRRLRQVRAVRPAQREALLMHRDVPGCRRLPVLREVAELVPHEHRPECTNVETEFADFVGGAFDTLAELKSDQNQDVDELRALLKEKTQQVEHCIAERAKVQEEAEAVLMEVAKQFKEKMTTQVEKLRADNEELKAKYECEVLARQQLQYLRVENEKMVAEFRHMKSCCNEYGVSGWGDFQKRYDALLQSNARYEKLLVERTMSQIEKEDYYLNVPFRDREVARAMGAVWSPGAKKWFVPAGKDIAPFHVWDREGLNLNV